MIIFALKATYGYIFPLQTDVTGACETRYTVNYDRGDDEASSSVKMYVSTTHNYDNCLNKPFYVQGLFQGVYRSPSEKV